MTNKKVCMVVSNPFVNDSRVLKEAQSLVRNGYAVTVFATEGGRFKEEEWIGNILVKRLKVKNYSLIHLKFWKLYTVFYKLARIIGDEHAAIYHAHDADTLLMCFLAAKRNNAKLVYDFHEYWRSKTYFSRNFFEVVWNKTIKKLEFLVIEKVVSPRVDALITVNDSLANEFEKNNRVEEKPTVLYNAPYFSDLTEKDRQLLRKKIGADPNDKLVLFLGGLNKNRGLDNLVESLNFLGEDFKLVFVGYGPLKDKLQAMGKIKNYQGRIFVVDAVSSAEVPRWASGADVGAAPIQNVSWSYFHSSPNKIFEYLMAGLPIACSDFPEMRKLVEENNVGVVFDPDNPHDIARAIKEIISNKNWYQEMKSNALKAAKEKYNWGIEERKLLALYRKL